MTPVLLLPAALAALTALAIPLVIHLARKTEQRPTDFAALRWLRERPRPRHRPRIDEWPLLIVRLVLLALLALFLARPALFGSADTRAVVAVVPGIVAPVAHASERVVWLAPGFPDIATPAPTDAPIASLIRQLDAELPPTAPLRIIVPATLQGADAERPRLTRAVTWQIVPGAMPAPAARAVRATIAIRGPSRHIAAAATALGIRDIGPADRAVHPDTTALVWTAPGALPATAQAVLDRGGTVMIGPAIPIGEGTATTVWRDATGGPVVERVDVPHDRLLRFTRPLAPASLPALLDGDFPRRLRALLTPAPPAPARVAASDYAPTSGARAYPQATIDLRAWAAIAIAALFLAERLLATRRRRAVAP